MIRNGMWFENEEHYRFYLRKMKPVFDAFERASKTIISPIIKRVEKILAKE